MRVILGLSILLTLAIALAACSPAPVADEGTAPATTGDEGGAPAVARPDPGGTPAQPNFEPAPDKPNEIVEGMASGKLQGDWKAEPTAEQIKGFDQVKANPENPEGGEGMKPPDPAQIAKSAMSVAAQEITMSMGDQQRTTRYYIVEDAEQSILYEVEMDKGPGAEGEPTGARGRFKVTFDGDDKILVQPHEMDGFDLTFVRAT